MKHLQLFVYVLSIVFFISCNKSDTKTDYVTVNHTDASGYNYETVSNDPQD